MIPIKILIYNIMALFDELSKIVENEKQKKLEAEKNNVELQKKKQIELQQLKIKQEMAKKYSDFRQNFEYGKMNPNNNNMIHVGDKLTFEQCLNKAYCKDITNVEKDKGICANDDNFYPYLAWKDENNFGKCYIGSMKNDSTQFNYNGNDAIPVYITPVMNDNQSLEMRESIAKKM